MNVAVSRGDCMFLEQRDVKIRVENNIGRHYLSEGRVHVCIHKLVISTSSAYVLVWNNVFQQILFSRSASDTVAIIFFEEGEGLGSGEGGRELSSRWTHIWVDWLA